MSMPSEPDFDEFDGLDDGAFSMPAEESMSLPEQDFGIFSMPAEEKNEPSSAAPIQTPVAQPSSKPTVSTKSPTSVTIITLPVPDDETFDEFDISMSISLSIPSEPSFEDFNGMDDTDSSMSMTSADDDQPIIVTLPTPPEEEAFDGFSMPAEPVSISMSMSADDGFDGVGEGQWQNEGSMPYGDRPAESLSMSLPNEGSDGIGDWWWVNEGSMPYGDRPEVSLSMSIPNDDGFDGVGDGWWLNEGSMPYGDRPEASLSMSIPNDDGFDGVGDGWWLNEGSMPYGERPIMSLSLSLSMSISMPHEAEESFSNDVDEYQFNWAM